MRNLEVLKKQGRELLDQRRDEFVRQSLLSDEFLNMIQKNMASAPLRPSLMLWSFMRVTMILELIISIHGMSIMSSPRLLTFWKN